MSPVNLMTSALPAPSTQRAGSGSANGIQGEDKVGKPLTPLQALPPNLPPGLGRTFCGFDEVKSTTLRVYPLLQCYVGSALVS